MNPVRWFDRDASSPSPSSASTSSSNRPAVARVAEDPARAAASPQAPQPAEPPRVVPRYAYERPAVPAPGKRADAERHFARGVREQREGRATQAMTEYLAAVQADPAYFEAHYNLGLAAFAAGHLPRSLSAYERALSIKPTDLNARFNFALALQKAGYLRDAVNELETVLAAHPGEVRAHLALANLLAQELGEPARARPHYLRVLEADPRHPQSVAIRQWLNAHP
jgi:tetratricopeptide (TPR) repeat protein